VTIGQVKIERSQKPGETHVVWFKAELTVKKSASCEPGTRAMFIERVTGHKFPHYKLDSDARIRSLIASAMGFSPDAPEIRAQFNDPQKINEIFSGVTRGQLNGKDVAVLNVEHKRLKPTPQKPQGGLIASYMFAPVGTQVQPPAPVQAAPAAAAPAPFSPAAFGAAPAFPPAGWFAHSQYPGYFTNGQHTVSESDLRVAQASGKV